MRNYYTYLSAIIAALSIISTTQAAKPAKLNLLPAKAFHSCAYLKTGLRNTPKYIFAPLQARKALQNAIHTYQIKNIVKQKISHPESELMIYVDKKHKAHWVFLVSFLVESKHTVKARPTFILDAITLNVYHEWNETLTAA